MAEHSRRVALIEPIGGHGGMDYYDLGLCRGLVAAGWRVGWYTCPETSDPGLPGVIFHPVFRGIWGKASRWKRAVRYLSGTLQALWQATAAGERVCHLHFFHGAPEELLVLCLARCCGRKVVLTVHDVESFAGGTPRNTMRRVYRWADRLIVHNQTSCQELIAKLDVLPARITVIPHGNYIDFRGAVPPEADARRTLNVPVQAKVILFFGQIKEVKGLDLLLEAVVQVATTVPEVVLLVAGRPWKDDFSRYQNQIQHLGIASRCRLHIRYIPDAEVSLFYSAADVVVLPYRRIYQSGVLLLAMSYGKAVVVSDLPGMTEIVREGETGYTFETGSSRELGQALIRVLSCNDERQIVAHNALTYVQLHHSWLRLATETASVYASLLN